MPLGQFDLSGNNICDTYQRILQINSPSGSCVLDGLGDPVLDLCLSGNLEVLGTITAQEFHTEIVSASIIFQSGSTKFGDSLDDKHQFTGSVCITGSFQVSGTTIFNNIDITAFSQSVQNRLTFEEFTSSNHETRIDALEASTRSIAIETGSTNLVASGLQSLLLGGTGSIDLAGDISITSLTASSISASTIIATSITGTNLIIDSSSFENRITILESGVGGLWSSSIDGHISRLSDVQITGNLCVTGDIKTDGTVDGIDLQFFSSSAETRITILEQASGSSSIDISNLQATVSRNEFTASDHETRIDVLEATTRSIAIETGSTNLVATGLESILLGGTGSIDLGSDITVTTITASNLTADSSSVSIRITNLETASGSQAVDITNLIFTASDHETRIDTLEAGGTQGFWTASNGIIKRVSDVCITGSLCVTDGLDVSGTFTLTGSLIISGGVINDNTIFAQLSSLEDQLPPDTNVTVITYNNQDDINGLIHSTSGSTPGEIEIVTPGFYFIMPQPQVGKDSGGTKQVFDMFLQVDRTGQFISEPNSNVKLSLKDPDITDVIVSGLTIFLDTGDKVRFMQRVSSAAVGMGLKFTAAEGTGSNDIPATPSVIFTMYRVGGGVQ